MYASQGFERKKRKFVDKQGYLLIKVRKFRGFSEEQTFLVEGEMRSTRKIKK